MNFKMAAKTLDACSLDDELNPEHQMISDKEHNKYIDKMEQHYADQLNIQEEKHMSKISQEALDYKPSSKTKLISDLAKVSTDLDLEDDEFEFDGKTIKQKVIIVKDEKYRVPITVIQQLQVILRDDPSVKEFKVLRSGTTKDDTKYTVVPIVTA